MGWGSDDKDPKTTRRRSGSMFNSENDGAETRDANQTVLLPEVSILTAKQTLEEAGAVCKDAGDGDWDIEFEGAKGLLWQRGEVRYVYTQAAPSSPLGKLLSKVGLHFSKPPSGGWDSGD